MPSEQVRFERSASVATLALNRPESRNALDVETVRELSRKLQLAAGDPGVRATRGSRRASLVIDFVATAYRVNLEFFE